jgi:hypothetical protein
MTTAYFTPWISFLLCCLLIIFWETMSYVQWRLWRSFIINYSTLDLKVFKIFKYYLDVYVLISKKEASPIKGERSITKSGEVLARQKRFEFSIILWAQQKTKSNTTKMTLITSKSLTKTLWLVLDQIWSVNNESQPKTSLIFT